MSKEMINSKGYTSKFIGRSKKLRVPLPELGATHRKDIAPVKGSDDDVLRYDRYSVVQNARRRLPFFSAANISGRSFRSIRRKDIFPSGRDRWLKDPRLNRKHQFGRELYKAPKSDFDRGHMTKREDVQWGRSISGAKKAAQKTFYYPNAAPQRAELNQAIWRHIEDYILHEESIENHLKISVFTGPVLQDKDPFFVTPVKKKSIQLPTLFWKVIYYTKSDKKLYRVCFMVGQEPLLEKHGLIRPKVVGRGIPEEDVFFLDFEEGETFQVPTTLVEELTGLSFADAIDPGVDKRPTKLILEEVSIRGIGGQTTTYVRGLAL